ncbi:MAG: hypothetical protein MUD15_06125 [Desulfobacterota bacterium]|jgi:hypothetical protein|nr:hypothetical protein [Thermodesulfobacteriota bacterium]
MKLKPEEKHFVAFHAVFTLICTLVVLVPMAAMGARVLGLVILYNVALPLHGVIRKDRQWTRIWLFSFVLSLFQVFPDWFLSAQLGILVFPDHGPWSIGTIAGYMAGLWTIPLFVIIFLAERVRDRSSADMAYISAALAALVIFGMSEMVAWRLPLWYARDVVMWGHTALYIIVPEIILGLSCLYGYNSVKGRGLGAIVPVAFLVMQLYLGSAAFFYFLVEKVVR